MVCRGRSNVAAHEPGRPRGSPVQYYEATREIRVLYGRPSRSPWLVYAQSLSTDEGQHFVAFLIHERGGLCFEVHAQQGFGVGGAHVEPPVAEIEGDAVKMIDGLRLRTVVFFERLQLARYVLDTSVDLTTSHPLIERLEQFGERFVLDGDQFQHDEQGDQAGVGEPVVAEVEVAGMLAAVNGVQAAHLGFNI